MYAAMQMEDQRNVIIADSLDGVGTDAFKDYLAHAFCTEGLCGFLFNGKEFEMRAGDVLIVRKGKLMEMLEDGSYREHREVTWYADCLYITSKYLSEVSKKVSGYAANYWINRYTILDISRLLKDKSLTFVQISDMFGFSSPAYFSRYVQHNLGMNPTDYRE